MSRARARDGFTLVEMLLVMTLSLIMLGATLAVFSTMERNSKRNQLQQEAQRDARVATNILALRLRNLANPVAAGTGTAQPIERAEAQDLVFRSVRSSGAPTTLNPFNLQRDRFCLGSDGNLHRYTQTWTGAAPGMPTGTACGTTVSGWGSPRVVAQHVVNGSRPVFSYLVGAAPVTEQTAPTVASFSSISGIRTSLFIDAQPSLPPVETELSTRIFLRNQNRAPVATFTASCGASRQVVLNGSESSDPEGGPLTFRWFDGTTQIGTGVTFTTPTLSAGTHSLSLTVTDGGALTATAPAQTATIRTTSPACTIT